MTFSIVIPTKDRPLDLQNCVKSIVNQTVLPQELIIVDASSDGISTENIKNCKDIIRDRVKVVYIRSQPAVSKQRNIGAERASSDIVFFFDDDIVLEKNYHEKVLEVYELKKGQNIAGVQGSISNYYNLTWIHRIFRKLFFMTRASKNEKSRFLSSLGYVYIPLPKEIIEVEAIAAGLCSYYREIFNEFKFDEAFDRCTDLELSYRVSRKYKLYQTPYAVAFHHRSQETHLNIRELNKLYIIHMHMLVNKHMPKKLKNWLAYYWSIIGDLILSTVKSFVSLRLDAFMGTLEGINYILTHSKNSYKR